MHWAHGMAAILGALAVSWGRPAQACGPCTCDDQPRDIMNLIRGLPLNLQIPLAVFEESEAPPWLERVSDGTEVAATVERRDAMAAWWLAVDQDLEPNTDYQVVRESGIAAVFTTGSARDESPPTLTAIEALGGGNEALCDGSFGGGLTLTGAGDGETFNVWLELEVVAGATPRIIYADLNTGNMRLPLGSSAMGCFGRLEVPELAEGGGVALGARIFDAAGNASELRTTVLQAVANEPAGCGSPTGNAGSGPTEPGDGGTASVAGSSGSPAVPEDDPTRTSKGCGCSLPGSPEPRCAALLPLALLLAFRRRSRLRP